MPIEVIDHILSFSFNKCKTCYKIISIKDLNNLIFLKKHYYCSKKCFNHI